MVSIENLKILKYHTFLKKQFFLLAVVSVAVKMKRYLKMKNRLKYEKIIALITFENMSEENTRLDFRLRNRGCKKLSFRRNKT